MSRINKIIFNIKKSIKKVGHEKIFNFIFIFVVSFPIIFFVFFGVFIDCSAIKKVKIKNILDGSYQKNITSFFMQHIPIYTELSYFKPSINNFTRQYFLNGVYYSKKVGLIKDPEIFDFEVKNRFLHAISNFHNRSYNIPLYYIVIPTKWHVSGDYVSRFEEDKFYYDKDDWFRIEKNKNEKIYKLDESVIADKSKDINFFYRTSSRLNSLGAYSIYKKNIKKLGQEAFSFDSFNIWHLVDNYYGELFNRNFKLRVEPDTIDIFKCNLKDVETKVSEFYNDGSVRARNTIFDIERIDSFDRASISFGGEAPIKVVETDLKDKETILIFADETINNLIQFLILHYKKIVIVDLNEIFLPLFEKVYSNINDFKLLKYDKVLFLYNIESLKNINIFKNLNRFNLYNNY